MHSSHLSLLSNVIFLNCNVLLWQILEGYINEGVLWACLCVEIRSIFPDNVQTFSIVCLGLRGEQSYVNYWWHQFSLKSVQLAFLWISCSVVVVNCLVIIVKSASYFKIWGNSLKNIEVITKPYPKMKLNYGNCWKPYIQNLVHLST